MKNLALDTSTSCIMTHRWRGATIIKKLISDRDCKDHSDLHTVPLETMGPFAAILPRSNRGFDLQFHLGKTLSYRIKNLGFT